MAFKVVMIGNNKGGVGKSFVSKTFSEFAAIIARLRVLMIDLDPQTNLSQRFLTMEVLPDGSHDFSPPQHPLYDREKEEREALEQGTEVWDGYSDSADIWLAPFIEPYPVNIVDDQDVVLDIIPAHAKKLQSIELVEQRDVFDKVVRRLRDFIYLTGHEEDYDLVVIDLRPSKGPLVQAALYAATHLLIPSEMESPSVEGLQGMLSARHHINLKRPPESPLEIAGILPNKVRAQTTLHQEFMSMLRDDPAVGPYLLDSAISDWTGYREAMVPGAPSIFTLSEKNKHRAQLESVYRPLLDSIMEA